MLSRIITAIVTWVYDVIALAASRFNLVPVARGWNWNQEVENTSELEGVNDIIKRFMKAQGIKAGQCAIRIDGTVELNGAYTWAPPDYLLTKKNFVFRIASCSKAFATAAIFRLISQGKLNGSDRVFDILGLEASEPEPQDSRVKNITIQNLVEHKGGWDYVDSTADPVFHLFAVIREFNLTAAPDKLDFAKYIYRKISLDFPPGEQVCYSNIGYTLLGLVVEKVSGSNFIDFLQAEILAADGITDVYVGATRPGGRRENEVYYEDPGVGADVTRPQEVSIVPYPYGGNGAMTEVMDSSGGLVTSAASLADFVGKHNINVEQITETDAREIGERAGNMSGTFAYAECLNFLTKGGTLLKVEWAIIFNRCRVGNKNGETGNIQFDELNADIRQKIMDR